MMSAPNVPGELRLSFFQGVIQVDDVFLVGVMLAVVELIRVLEWWDAEKG
jgi:hypothetical protein